jgi:menaquinone-dependent protoporphyrinogen oxidase
MKPILVAYASTEGQTRKVAEYIAERLRAGGQLVELADTADRAAMAAASDCARYRAVVLGGSVHYGRHQRALARFVRQHLSWLNAMPTALFSVSMAAAEVGAAGRAEAQRVVTRFVRKSGLRPRQTRLVGGALRYTHYGLAKRALMRWIAGKQGQSTDTKHDHEYTDWQDVDRFVATFLSTLNGTEAKPAARGGTAELIRLQTFSAGAATPMLSDQVGRLPAR